MIERSGAKKFSGLGRRLGGTNEDDDNINEEDDDDRNEIIDNSNLKTMVASQTEVIDLTDEPEFFPPANYSKYIDLVSSDESSDAEDSDSEESDAEDSGTDSNIYDLLRK